MVAVQDFLKRIRKPDILLLRPLWVLSPDHFVRKQPSYSVWQPS